MPSGRKKGSKSTNPEVLNNFFEFLVGKNIKRVQEEFEKLEGKELIGFTRDFFEYVRPKLARKEIVGEGGGPIQVVEIPNYGPKSNVKPVSAKRLSNPPMAGV